MARIEILTGAPFFGSHTARSVYARRRFSAFGR
jgi:hypothetical protein